MRISYNWLKDYIDIKVSPEELARTLTMAGLCVDSIHKRGDDSILEIEITSNRPDWLSYIGVAREVAAITGAKMKVNRLAGSPVSLLKQANRQTGKPANNISKPISVKVLDKKLCPRYTARAIRNVKVQESPKWLKDKIESIGLRSVNNIVDITNFCLFEMGEPMHAFDLDKLGGNSIVVRRAHNGEKIVAIDGVERALDNEMLVIADDAKAVAIAGVMGGAHSEVGIATKNILLEAAYFDQISIRRTSRKLALPTDSSYRFERKVDIENIKCASDRAAQLILDLAGGEAGEFIDVGKIPQNKNNITLRLDRLNKTLGIDMPQAKAKSILTSLGLKVKSSSKGALKLTPPEFRYDLQTEIDLIEEVARIYGYDNIPETIPPVMEAGKRLPTEIAIDKNIRDIMVSLGLFEIITYSLLSKKSLNLAGLTDDDVIAVKNPLSIEQEIMRPTLLAGMLNAIRWNINRKTKDLKFFELGKVYFKEPDNSFTEKKYLTLGITGQLYDGWIGRPRMETLFDLKGILETLFKGLGIESFSVKESRHNAFSPSACADIEVNQQTVGVIGQIDQKVSNNYDIKEALYAAEIDCEKLYGHISMEKRFKESPKFPSVIRDISIVADMNILNARILSLIKETAGGILKDAQLVDRYSGGQIPEGKIGLTYRLEYQDPKKTLQDSDIQDVHSRIVSALENNLGAKLRL